MLILYNSSGKLYQCSFLNCTQTSRYSHVILRHEYSHDYSKLTTENTENTNLELEETSIEKNVTSSDVNDYTSSTPKEPYLSEFEEKVVNFKIKANLSLNQFVELLQLLKDPRASTVRVSRNAAMRMGVEFHSDIDVPIFMKKTFSYQTKSGTVFSLLML